MRVRTPYSLLVVIVSVVLAGCAHPGRTATDASAATSPVVALSTAASPTVASSASAAPLIAFGTRLDPRAAMRAARRLADSLANPQAPQWQARGDQRRTYPFHDAGTDVAYRVAVPTSWDGHSPLPLVLFLHGAFNDESSYLDQNDRQMVRLADAHGYLLVSPLGYGGAYGTSLRLPAVFGETEVAAQLMAARTPERDHAQELSERDVLNVLELVLREYPVDRTALFLTGHSMGSGGTWYLGAKYADYWAALAPMSGPFVMAEGYPWERLRDMPILMTEGTGATPSLAGSRRLRDWMTERGFDLTYHEVDADHAGMVPLVLPDVFAFFDRVRASAQEEAAP